MSERPFTPYAAFESDFPPPPSSPHDGATLAPELPPTLPPDPRLPTDVDAPKGGELDHLAQRLGELSDSLHDPEGLVHRLFAAAEQKAAERHAELKRILADVATNGVEVLARLNALEPKVEEHDARLKLVPVSNGNGADHG